jgi:hypothetical protein
MIDEDKVGVEGKGVNEVRGSGLEKLINMI